MNLEKGKAIAEDKGYVALIEAAPETAIEEKDTGVFYIPSSATTEKVDATVAATIGYTVTESGTTANEARQNKVASTAYEISDKNELIAFRDAWNTGNLSSGMTFVLTRDIDMAGYNWLDSIGIADHEFTGTFDGKGHTISNLSNGGMRTNEEFSISSTGAHGTTFGLFGKLSGTVLIKDFTITVNAVSAEGTGWAAVIGVADGKQCNLTLDSITVKGTIYGKDKVAGFIGQNPTYKNNGSTVVVRNCINEANVTGDRVGGITCASNHDGGSSYINCTNKGTLTATSGTYQTAAGIACVNQGEEFVDCKNEGVINATIGYNIATVVFIKPQTDGSYQITSNLSPENFETNMTRFVGGAYNGQEVDWEKVLIANAGMNQAWSNGYKAGVLYDTENASDYKFKFEKGQNFKTWDEAREYIHSGSFGELKCYESVSISSPLNETQPDYAIDFNNNTLTVENTKIFYVNGGHVTLSNVTINVNGNPEYLFESYTGTTTLNNVTLNYEGKLLGCIRAGYEATLVLNNCSIKGYIDLSGNDTTSILINGTKYSRSNGQYIIFNGETWTQASSLN